MLVQDRAALSARVTGAVAAPDTLTIVMGPTPHAGGAATVGAGIRLVVFFSWHLSTVR